MRAKKVALIDPKLLMLSNEFLRRAQREQKFRFKRGRRIEAIAHAYNLLACGLVSNYEEFVALCERALGEK